MRLFVKHTENYEIEVSKEKLIQLFNSIGIKEVNIETMTGIEEYDHRTFSGKVFHHRIKIDLMDYIDDIYEKLLSVADTVGLPLIETEGEVVVETEDPYEIKFGDFHTDEEKMVDFWQLTKEEFLLSYSYLTEEEYDLTVEYFKKKLEEK